MHFEKKYKPLYACLVSSNYEKKCKSFGGKPFCKPFWNGLMRLQIVSRRPPKLTRYSNCSGTRMGFFTCHHCDIQHKISKT